MYVRLIGVRLLPPAVLAALIVLIAGATTPAAARGAAKEPLPQVLEATESSAEDLIDFALAADRGRVVAGARKLERAAAQAVPVLRRADLAEAELTALRRRAAHVAALSRSGSFIDVALAANAVSEVMPDLYSHFAVNVPPSVLALDFLEREVQLRARAGHTARVPGLVRRVTRTWSGLRPRVVARGGRREAAAFDGHLAAMKRLAPNAGAALQREAAAGLELVDDLERVFG
jgi:hypothetical protein